MTWLLLGAIAIAAAITAFRYWGRQPVIYRGIAVRDLRRFIHGLVLQASAGSLLIAEREGGEGFIQLALVKASNGWGEVELGIPDVAWSNASFAQIELALDSAGFSPSTEQLPGSMRFMRTRFAGTPDVVADAASRAAALVAQELAWSESTFTVHYDGQLRAPVSRGA